jgi:hypothetical protein
MHELKRTHTMNETMNFTANRKKRYDLNAKHFAVVPRQSSGNQPGRNTYQPAGVVAMIVCARAACTRRALLRNSRREFDLPDAGAPHGVKSA